MKMWRDRLAERVRTIKESTPCADCGKRYPYYVMDFDHIPELGQKDRPVSQVKHNGTRKQILEEIEKCEVVCANCHRIRTHIRSKGLYGNIVGVAAKAK